jgi:hypothetical protein
VDFWAFRRQGASCFSDSGRLGLSVVVVVDMAEALHGVGLQGWGCGRKSFGGRVKDCWIGCDRGTVGMHAARDGGGNPLSREWGTVGPSREREGKTGEQR